MPRVLIPIGVILLAVVLGLVAVKYSIKEPPRGTAVTVGQPVQTPTLYQINPTLEVKTMEWEAVANKVVFINFWATWCEACMVEIPSIIALREHYKGKGLEVVLMNVDENPKTVLAAALKSLNIAFPVYIDQTGDWSQQLQVRGIPFSVVLDRNRNVLFFETGERNWNSNAVRKQFDLWLKQ